MSGMCFRRATTVGSLPGGCRLFQSPLLAKYTSLVPDVPRSNRTRGTAHVGLALGCQRSSTCALSLPLSEFQLRHEIQDRATYPIHKTLVEVLDQHNLRALLQHEGRVDHVIQLTLSPGSGLLIGYARATVNGPKGDGSPGEAFKPGSVCPRDLVTCWKPVEGECVANTYSIRPTIAWPPSSLPSSAACAVTGRAHQYLL
jgi:hypothetical protein